MRALLPQGVLAACALFAGPLWADTAASLQTLDHCLDTLTLNAANAPAAKAPKGIDGLRPLCPELEHAILDLPLHEELPEHWQDSLDRSGVADLAALLHRYGSPPLSAVPRVPTLYPIAQSLNPPQQRHSWWQGVKDWLRQLLAAPATSGPSWFTRWFSPASLPQLLLRSILYAMLGAILIMAWWIIWRELQAAGLTAAAARRARQPSVPAPILPARLLKLDDVEAAPLREQPAWLLRLLVQALLQSGRLNNERSLTHRELGPRSAFDDAQQQVSFESLSLLAERLLYGPNVPASSAAGQPQIEHALTAGRRLYAQLLGSQAEAR